MAAKIAGVVGVVLVAAAAASPYVMGMLVEQHVRDDLAKVPANPAYKVELERYDRGYASSESVFAMSLVFKPGEPPVVVHVANHIEHGPFVGGFNLARIKSELQLSPEQAAALKPVFGDQPPIASTALVHLDGSSDGTITSPVGSFKGDEANPMAADWKGLQATYHADRMPGRVKFDGDAPGLTAGPPGAAPVIALEGLKLAFDGTVDESMSLFNGTGAFDVAHVGFQDPKSGEHADLAGLHLSSTSGETNGLLTMSTGIHASQVTVAPNVIKDVVFDLSMHDLDAAAFRELQTFIQQNSASGNEEQMGQLMLAKMKTLGGQFLQRKPWLSIDRLSFTFNDQPLSVAAKIQYTGAGDPATFNPMMDLTGNVRAEAPQAMVATLFQKQQVSTMRKQREAAMAGEDEESPPVPEPSAEELAAMEAQAKLATQQTLEGLVQQNLIVVAGTDRYAAEASIDHGKILVNGKPFGPPPGAGGEGAGPDEEAAPADAPAE